MVCVALQAGRVLSARPIRCHDVSATVTFVGARRSILVWHIKVDGLDMIRHDTCTPLIEILYKF